MGAYHRRFCSPAAVDPAAGCNGHFKRRVYAGGVTLVELLISVTVVALLASSAVYSIANTTRAAREQTALARAEVLDAARRSFLLSRPDAEAVWQATSETARMPLLMNAGLLSAPADYLQVSGGYELQLSGALADRTRVRMHGTEVSR